MHKRGHLNKLLTTVASYDHGEAINLNSTFKSPLQNKGDELLRENKNYAVVYNSVVGGTYEVFRKVQAQEVKMNIERYGLSENSTNDVKQLYKANESQTQKQSDSSSLSPIMKRYTSMKEQHPDALLFRCGDFYETYKEDAVKASNILGITLTKHSKRMDEEGKPLKMAGFPYYALDTYLPKLIRAGERVGICEQLEMPRKEKVKQTKSTKADIDTKEVRDNLVNRIVETVGKNNHHAFVLPLSDKALNVETNKERMQNLLKCRCCVDVLPSLIQKIISYNSVI